MLPGACCVSIFKRAENKQRRLHVRPLTTLPSDRQIFGIGALGRGLRPEILQGRKLLRILDVESSWELLRFIFWQLKGLERFLRIGKFQKLFGRFQDQALLETNKIGKLLHRTVPRKPQ